MINCTLHYNLIFIYKTNSTYKKDKKIMNCTNVIFVFFLLFMIEKSIGELYCNLTFNSSNPSTYLAYNSTFSTCPFCPQMNFDNQYCPPKPGPPITCVDCLYAYCNISNTAIAAAFCGY